MERFCWLAPCLCNGLDKRGLLSGPSKAREWPFIMFPNCLWGITLLCFFNFYPERIHSYWIDIFLRKINEQPNH